MASPSIRNGQPRKSVSPNLRRTTIVNPLHNFWAEKLRPDVTEEKVEIERLKTIVLS